VADRGEQARECGAGEERRFERAGREHHLFARVEVARHDPERHEQLVAGRRGVASRGERALAVVVEEMVVPSEQVPCT